MPNLPYKTAGWDTHSQSRLREISYPLFECEPTHFTVRRFYEGPDATFGSIPALNTADTEFAAAKFLLEGPHVPTDGGAIAYDRLFATVPASWNDFQEYAFTYPAFAAAATGTSYPISAITAGTTGYVISTTATGIAVGDSVFISAAFTRNGRNYTEAFFDKVQAVVAGISITTYRYFVDIGPITAVSGSVRKSLAGRLEPKTLPVPSRIQNDYALTSDTALDTDLPLLVPFTPVDTYGNYTNYITGTTTPNYAAYTAFVTGRTEIVAECQRRRYLGNIYRRSTRFVVAR